MYLAIFLTVFVIAVTVKVSNRKNHRGYCRYCESKIKFRRGQYANACPKCGRIQL